MKKLTEKQHAFVVNKAAGLKNKEAAIAAGYSVVSADVQAGQLMIRSDIKAAIRAAKKKGSKDASDVAGVVGALEAAGISTGDDKFKMPKASYTDAKEFLIDAMNHKMLPVALRGDYAKALLPYQHGRIGETGKKEAAKDRARKLTGTGDGKGKSKFAPKGAPPRLHVVGGTSR